MSPKSREERGEGGIAGRAAQTTVGRGGLCADKGER